MAKSGSRFSAAESGLGHFYQFRLALLKVLSLPEETIVFVEGADDLEFVDDGGVATLASLKHKAVGDTVTDLSADFWKSVRVWLNHYLADGRLASQAQFILLTTAEISDASFLASFAEENSDGCARDAAASLALAHSTSKLSGELRDGFAKLTPLERADFWTRIAIFEGCPRITDIPELIERQLRTVRREARVPLFERLEGWWVDQVIKLMAGRRAELSGHEVSDRLSAFAEEYRSDNLPITFRGKLPGGKIDPDNDPRLFVEQLRALGLPARRIQNAIVDYYRAFEQRSSWARESLLISGEIEEYEDRLVEEWIHFREIICENIEDTTEDEACISAGKELYRWAETDTEMLRIRERVTEPYVVRGAFHILANAQPSPRVYWHPHFLRRLAKLLGVSA
jgi:hypothetical protein